MNRLFNTTIVETNGVRTIAGGGTGASTAQTALAALGGIGDAPNDGKQYARQSQGWSAVTGLTSLNAIQVLIGSTAAANGANLLAAYTAAKALTPNGSALSATNRAVVLLPPATYTTTSGLTLDSQFVDIQGVSDNANHVVIDKVTQTANNVHVSNITIVTDGCSISSNLSLAVWTNCIATSATNKGGFCGTSAILSGTFNNCIGTSTSLSGGGFGGAQATLSGTFKFCTGNANFAGLNGGFVGSGIVSIRSYLSGVFINCQGNGASSLGSAGFGGDSCDMSGTMINCICNGEQPIVGYYASTPIISGKVINCTSSSNTGLGTCTITGKIRNYTDGLGDTYNYN